MSDQNPESAPQTLDFDSLKIDPARSGDGVWVEFITERTGTFSLRLAYAGLSNKAVVAKIRALSAPHRRAMEVMGDDFPVEKNLAIIKQAYSEVIIRGLRDASGKDLPYTPALGMKILASDALFKEIQTFAQKEANFRSVVLEGELGNSGPASSIP